MAATNLKISQLGLLVATGWESSHTSNFLALWNVPLTTEKLCLRNAISLLLTTTEFHPELGGISSSILTGMVGKQLTDHKQYFMTKKLI